MQNLSKASASPQGHVSKPAWTWAPQPGGGVEGEAWHELEDGEGFASLCPSLAMARHCSPRARTRGGCDLQSAQTQP